MKQKKNVTVVAPRSEEEEEEIHRKPHWKFFLRVTIKILFIIIRLIVMYYKLKR